MTTCCILYRKLFPCVLIHTLYRPKSFITAFTPLLKEENAKKFLLQIKKTGTRKCACLLIILLFLNGFMLFHNAHIRGANYLACGV